MAFSIDPFISHVYNLTQTVYTLLLIQLYKQYNVYLKCYNDYTSLIQCEALGEHIIFDCLCLFLIS